LSSACYRIQIAAEHGVESQWDGVASSPTRPFRTQADMIVSADAAGAPGQNWDQMMAAAQTGDAYAYRDLLAELAARLRRHTQGACHDGGRGSGCSASTVAMATIYPAAIQT
jgi:hypothetical protein